MAAYFDPGQNFHTFASLMENVQEGQFISLREGELRTVNSEDLKISAKTKSFFAMFLPENIAQPAEVALRDRIREVKTTIEGLPDSLSPSEKSKLIQQLKTMHKGLGILEQSYSMSGIDNMGATIRDQVSWLQNSIDRLESGIPNVSISQGNRINTEALKRATYDYIARSAAIDMQFMRQVGGSFKDYQNAAKAVETLDAMAKQLINRPLFTLSRNPLNSEEAQVLCQELRIEYPGDDQLQDFSNALFDRYHRIRAQCYSIGNDALTSSKIAAIQTLPLNRPPIQYASFKDAFHPNNGQNGHPDGILDRFGATGNAAFVIDITGHNKPSHQERVTKGVGNFEESFSAKVGNAKTIQELENSVKEELKTLAKNLTENEVDGLFSAAIPLTIQGTKMLMTVQIGDSVIFHIPAGSNTAKPITKETDSTLASNQPVFSYHPVLEGDLIPVMTDGIPDWLGELGENEDPTKKRTPKQQASAIGKIAYAFTNPAEFLQACFEESKNGFQPFVQSYKKEQQKAIGNKFTVSEERAEQSYQNKISDAKGDPEKLLIAAQYKKDVLEHLQKDREKTEGAWAYGGDAADDATAVAILIG